MAMSTGKLIFWSSVTKGCEKSILPEVVILCQRRNILGMLSLSGARGENRYGFKIDLYDDIKPERTECRVTDRQVR